MVGEIIPEWRATSPGIRTITFAVSSDPSADARASRADICFSRPYFPARRFAITMALHRHRRQKGLRCITIEILDAEIDVLIRRGHLARDRRADRIAVRNALHALLDDVLR